MMSTTKIYIIKFGNVCVAEVELLTYFRASGIVRVELILWMDAWLKTKPKPRMILPTNKLQKECRNVGSVSKLDKKSNAHLR